MPVFVYNRPRASTPRLFKLISLFYFILFHIYFLSWMFFQGLLIHRRGWLRNYSTTRSYTFVLSSAHTDSLEKLNTRYNYGYARTIAIARRPLISPNRILKLNWKRKEGIHLYRTNFHPRFLWATGVPFRSSHLSLSLALALSPSLSLSSLSIIHAISIALLTSFKSY